ncbi:hypothetical protein MKX57_10920 [Lysinibacillus sp. FSL M8-0216]|uniref:hypothetical protein n=1 Tax=Lysinibacillus sp. FSL M8-0216 TaxID=2921619 RepID=UPI00315A91A5
MSVYTIFNKMYKHAIEDENLLRYLFYVPQHKDDDVTLVTAERANLVGNFDVINQIVKMRKRNEDDLSIDDSKCVLYMYLDNFENATTGTNNAIDPYSFLQSVNIDVYVHRDYQNTSYNLARVVDRVTALFNQKHVGGIGNVTFAGSGKLDDVDGFEGMQIKFKNRYSTR